MPYSILEALKDLNIYETRIKTKTTGKSTLRENLLDHLPSTAVDTLKNIIGKTVSTNRDNGSIIDFDISALADISDQEDSIWGTVTIQFPDGVKKYVLEHHPKYKVDDDTQKILDEFNNFLIISQRKEEEKLKQARKIEAETLAEQHFRDGFKVWVNYFKGKIKTLPKGIPLHFDWVAYMEKWQQLLDAKKADFYAARTLNDASNTIRSTYSGNIVELIKWLDKTITSITISPGRRETEEKIKTLLTYLENSGADLSRVKSGDKARGELRNYTMQLQANALDTCPDVEAFMNWLAPKYDFTIGKDVIRNAYNPNDNVIDSRLVVLDYLLNRKNYLDESNK